MSANTKHVYHEDLEVKGALVIIIGPIHRVIQIVSCVARSLSSTETDDLIEN